MSGPLGTGATLGADINLIVQIVMGLMLLVGFALARRRNFRAHKYCQTSVMLLNLVMIALIMYPAFDRQVEPQLPDGLKDSYFLVAALHAGLGAIAELLGLYIVLVAATNLLPRSLRFKRFKPWMRTELALWWIVLIIGIGTYYVWYIAPPTAASNRQTVEAAERISVTIENNKFEPKALTIAEGATVEWIDLTGRHTVEADDGSFKSEMLAPGGRFEKRFDKPGIYPYFCGFHGDKGGQDMAGVITVITRPK
jgi:plastocyanin/uncharacterized membrane protein YozB (DUF420 family)